MPACEQCLAILPWRFEPCLVARGDHYRLLLVAGSAIAAGSIKRRRHAPSPRAKRVGRAGAPHAGTKSSADAELLDQSLVAGLVGAPQVIEQRAALAHHLEQATAGMVVLDVGLEMLGEIVDAFGKDRHLNFGRSGIAGLVGERSNNFGLAAGGNRHRSSFLDAGAANQAGEVEHALGDDFAVVQIGKGHQLAGYRGIDWTAEIGSIPSAQQNGLASLQPRRIRPTDGQRRDVVQRGLNGHEGVGEASLADALMPVETALDDIPALAISRADAARLTRGQAVLLRGRDAPNFRGTVYVTVSGQLLALAELDRGEIVPKRVFNLAGLIGRARLSEKG